MNEVVNLFILFKLIIHRLMSIYKLEQIDLRQYKHYKTMTRHK